MLFCDGVHLFLSGDNNTALQFQPLANPSAADTPWVNFAAVQNHAKNNTASHGQPNHH
jgi:hypothetical protein